MRLRVVAPYAWEPLAGFLRARAIPGVEEVDLSRWRRQTPGGVLEVRARGERLELHGAASEDEVARVRRVLDADRDPAAVAAVLARDPALAPSVTRVPGLRVPGAWDLFELAVRAILGQQISVARASALAGKVVAAWGPGGRLFPPAAALAGLAGDEIARVVGMPRARGHAIARLAGAVVGGALPLGGSDEELVRALCALPGIGPWTAEYIAMRLGRHDAFPAGDLWLRRALGLDERALRRRSEAWRPYRAYAAMHLWLAPPGPAT